jgi:hypothetical protein
MIEVYLKQLLKLRHLLALQSLSTPLTKPHTQLNPLLLSHTDIHILLPLLQALPFFPFLLRAKVEREQPTKLLKALVLTSLTKRGRLLSLHLHSTHLILPVLKLLLLLLEFLKLRTQVTCRTLLLTAARD